LLGGFDVANRSDYLVRAQQEFNETDSTEWREGRLRAVRLAGMMREVQHFDGCWFRLQPAFYSWPGNSVNGTGRRRRF
jgi:hypothetical protein